MNLQVESIMNRARSVRALIMAEAQQATPEEMTHKPGSRWSVCDILVHLGNCDEESAIWLDYLLKGETPPQQQHMIPPDEWNAQHLAKYAHLDTPGALDYLQETHRCFEAVAARITEEHLKSNPRFIPHLAMTPGHELCHLHQIREALAVASGDARGAALHSLAQARQSVLAYLNLESRPGSAFEWRPESGGWSIKETLMHLAIWDRFAVSVFEALAEGRELPPMPCPEGKLHQWNQEQVEARSWQSLADVFHELGAAWGALEEQMKRLTPAQLAEDRVQGVATVYREHDIHHAKKIRERLRQWRQATRK